MSGGMPPGGMREEDIRPATLMEQFTALLKRDAERLASGRAEFVEVACPFCASSSSSPAFEKDGFAYRSCAWCGSLYVSPRPTAAALMEHAASAEAARFWSTHLYRQTAEARREKIFRPRAQLVAELVRDGVLQQAEVAVDIGAGYGLFLLELAALGLFSRLLGIEPDARLAEICRGHGLAVVEKWIEDVGPNEVAADLATSFEVLEHVFAPAEFVAACARTLRPGGVLLLTTLTIGGFDLQVLGSDSRAISPPEHINFPSLGGIERLLARAGLQIVDLSTPGQLDVDIVRNVAASKPDVPLPPFVRTLVQSDDRTRVDFQAFLREHRLSSHVRCVARRPD